MLKDELEAIIASDSGWSGISTLVLAVGILGEYAALPFLEEKHGAWKKLAKVIFAVLVVAGIVGEFGFSARIARNAAELQRISDGELSSAIDRASTAEQQTQVIRRENLVLQSQIAKLEAAATWRDFSKAQQDKFVSLTKQSLRADVPLPSIVFDSVVGNPEAKQYGGQLATALSEAIGNKIQAPLGLSTCVECIGVWICVNQNADRTTSDDAKVIRSLLERSGVKGAKFCTDPNNGQGTAASIKIIIGPKE